MQVGNTEKTEISESHFSEPWLLVEEMQSSLLGYVLFVVSSPCLLSCSFLLIQCNKLYMRLCQSLSIESDFFPKYLPSSITSRNLGSCPKPSKMNNEAFFLESISIYLLGPPWGLLSDLSLFLTAFMNWPTLLTGVPNRARSLSCD